MAMMYHKRATCTMISIFEVGISRSTKCDNLVDFPKSGHIYIYTVLLFYVLQLHD